METFERYDDLQLRGLRIWQDSREFCFGVDAVLLSGFADIKRGDTVLDLCCGNGIIPILLAGKTDAAGIWGIEISPVQAALAKRSVQDNHLPHVHIIEGDIKNTTALTGGMRFDCVTCNPPYIPDGGLYNPHYGKAIARHEILCTLEDVIKAAAASLQYGGHFFMVHRPDRMADVLVTMRQYRIEPKRLQAVQPYADSDAALFLIEGILGGGTGLKVMQPLVIYKEKGVYTDAALRYYGRDTK